MIWVVSALERSCCLQFKRCKACGERAEWRSFVPGGLLGRKSTLNTLAICARRLVPVGEHNEASIACMCVQQSSSRLRIVFTKACVS